MTIILPSVYVCVCVAVMVIRCSLVEECLVLWAIDRYSKKLKLSLPQTQCNMMVYRSPTPNYSGAS